jgi:Cu2+-containing amine oxidase
MTQHEMTKAELTHPLEMLTAEEVKRAVATLR